MSASLRSPLPGGPNRLQQSCRRRPGLLPLAAATLALMIAAPAHADLADDSPVAGLLPIADSDLATLCGGFRIGSYEFTLGAVVKTMVSDAAGRLLEVSSALSVPEIGTLTALGTTITPVSPGTSTPTTGTPQLAQTSQLIPSTIAAPVPSSVLPLDTTIALPGTTIISQGLFNTFVENTATDRVITHQTDLNLMISGLAQQAMHVNAAKLARIAGDAQVMFLGH